ncbi:MAG: anaerobic ribonucleoside-triphosphate reductase activating protein [Candidatus Fimenecus sp.]
MSTPLRLAGVIRESVVDGPGWRFVVFSQGCRHNCEGCHNPQTHDFNGGYMSDVDKIIGEIKKDPLLKGVTLSGGDPFEQAENFSVLAKEVHALGLDVVTYTGYTFEQLYKGMEKNEGWRHLLSETDILIDGKFVLAKKSLNCKFRGSTNQRVIDAKKSLAAGKAVETEI